MEQDYQKIVAAAKTGAEKSFEAQMELLEQFCGINCGSRNVEGNKRVVQLVDHVLVEIGADIEHIDSEEYGTYIVARLKPESPDGKIILNAHLDSAFFDDRVEDHPFHIDGEYAYGLGITDCKGGVVTILYAVKSMKEAGLLPNKEIVIIFNCDEEVGSLIGKQLFKKESSGAEAAICFEPARNKNGILTVRRGLALGKIIVHGIAAHAGLDGGVGASAVRELANLIIKLTDRSDLSIGMNYNVAPISGGGNTVVVADYAEASFCVPIDSPEVFERTKRDVLEYLPEQGIVPGCTIETSIEMEFPAMVRNEENVKLYDKIRHAGELMGLELPEEKSSNPADCGFFSELGVPVVDGLGPYMYNIHTTDEHMLIRTLTERTQLLGILLATM